MKICNSCSSIIDESKQKVHKIMCVSCYRKEKRVESLLITSNVCLSCNCNRSEKWYKNGTECRKCYRITKERGNLNERLKNNLRSRISKIVSGKVKKASAVSNLGCSIEEFKKYIENQFKDGMTWDNYGYKTWHIDHIKPLGLFDLTNESELLEACHYTNLQPMWAKDNLQKGVKHG